MHLSLLLKVTFAFLSSGLCLSQDQHLRRNLQPYLMGETTVNSLTEISTEAIEAPTQEQEEEKEVKISESALLKKLLKDYDKRARPVTSASTPVRVTVELFPIITEQLNEREQRLVSHVWLLLEWKDEYLQWNASEWGNITYVTLSANHVWRPRLVIGNSAGSVHGEVVNSDGDFRVIVLANGTVSMETAGETQTSCIVDITYFPFDYQACYIELDSWAEGNSKVQLVNRSDTLDLSKYRVGGQWYVTGTEVLRKPDSDSFDTYTSLLFVMYLRRKPLYYVFNLVLPSVVLALLALLVFILPPEAGEKMTLGITVLLSFTVFQLLVADSMPKTSDFIPVVAIYITSIMMITAFSLLLSVGILCLHYHWPDEPVSPRCKDFANFFAKLLCMKTYWSSNPVKRKPEVNTKHVFKSLTWNSYLQYEVKSETLKQSMILAKILDDVTYLRNVREEDILSVARRRDWIQIARVFDRLLLTVFLTFNIVMVVVLFTIVPNSKDNKPSNLTIF